MYLSILPITECNLHIIIIIKAKSNKNSFIKIIIVCILLFNKI